MTAIGIKILAIIMKCTLGVKREKVSFYFLQTCRTTHGNSFILLTAIVCKFACDLISARSNMSSRIFIGHLSTHARERDVEKFFKGYGHIKEINLKNGFGFVVSVIRHFREILFDSSSFYAL